MLNAMTYAGDMRTAYGAETGSSGTHRSYT